MANDHLWLTRSLRQMGRALHWRDSVRLAARTLWMAAALAAAIQMLARFVPLAERQSWSFVPAGLWLVLMLLYAAIRTGSQHRIARRLDRELGLKDRLGTAVEIAAGRLHSNLDEQQLSDTRRIAQQLHPRQLGWHIPRRPLWAAAVLLALTLVLTWWPNPLDMVVAQRAAVAAAAEEQVEAIRQARQELATSTDPLAEERAQALQALQELMAELAQNPGDLEAALAELAEAQAELAALQRPQSEVEAAAMQDLARQLRNLANTNDNSSDPLDGASDALAQLSAQAGSLDGAAAQTLAESLESLAAEAALSDAELAEALAELAEALRNSDITQAAEARQAAQQALARNARDAQLNAALQAAQARLENSRQAMAQAGQRQNAGQNAGNQPGQNAGQNAGMSGGGSRANQLPPNTGSGQARNPNSANRAPGLRENETIFAPGWTQQFAGDPDFVAGQQGPDGQEIIREERDPLPGLTNPSLVPYRQVYQQYATEAATAIDREQIAPQHRDLVRDYFSQLNPN